MCYIGVGREGMTPGIFIHDTDKVEGGLMVRFFGLVFSVDLPSGNCSAYALMCYPGHVDCCGEAPQSLCQRCSQHLKKEDIF